MSGLEAWTLFVRPSEFRHVTDVSVKSPKETEKPFGDAT